VGDASGWEYLRTLVVRCIENEISYGKNRYKITRFVLAKIRKSSVRKRRDPFINCKGCGRKLILIYMKEIGIQISFGMTSKTLLLNHSSLLGISNSVYLYGLKNYDEPVLHWFVDGSQRHIYEQWKHAKTSGILRCVFWWELTTVSKEYTASETSADFHRTTRRYILEDRWPPLRESQILQNKNTWLYNFPDPLAVIWKKVWNAGNHIWFLC
jgi:hypothetical protein